MKAVLRIDNRDELEGLLRRKPLFSLPKVTAYEKKQMFLIFGLFIIVAIILPIIALNIGINQGQKNGYHHGYEAGYDAAVKEVAMSEKLSFLDAVAWNVRLNLDTYITWFGIIVGMAWILHGVGFHLVKG